jgi:fumarate hydratase class II
MLPVIAHNLLLSIELLANSARSLTRSAIAGFVVNRARIEAALERNPMLVTALSPIVGYEAAAAIARRAYAEQRPVREVAAEMTGIEPAELARLLDPARLTGGGSPGRQAGGG